MSEDLNKPTHITPADGNVFEDIGFEKEEAVQLLEEAKATIKEERKTKEKVSVYKKVARKRKHTPGPSKKKKRVTSVEKLKVLELVMEGKTVAEIATALDRSMPAITKTINELKEKTKAAFGDEIATGLGDDVISSINYVETPGFARIVNKLVDEGLTPEIARARVIKVFVTAQNADLQEVGELEVYQAAKSTVSGKEIFSKKTDKGKTSVVVMNSGASERGDNLTQRKKSSNIQDHVDGNRIFKIN